MVRLLIALATTLVLAAPAGAASFSIKAPACHRSTATPRVIATRTTTASGRATIVACDRASGHRRTLRRGYISESQNRLPALGVPAVQGTKVLWSELAGSAGHVRQDLRTADVRRDATALRRRIGPTPEPSRREPLSVDSDVLQVLPLPKGAIAYSAYSGAFATRLVLERPGRPARRFAKDDNHAPFVEDGRTLVWQHGDFYRAIDVAPPRRDAAGCPVRSAFRDVLLDTPALRVSLAGYDDDLFGDAAIRVCWKATGHDAIATTLFGETSLDDHVVANGPYFALTTADIDRYQYCDNAEAASPGVTVIDARTGRSLRGGLHGGCATVQSLVLSATGVPAWLITGDGTQRVEVPGSSPAQDTVLDSGPPGSLADLTANPAGTGFTWTHDGVRRGWNARP